MPWIWGLLALLLLVLPAAQALDRNPAPGQNILFIFDAATETDLIRDFGASRVGEDFRRYEVPPGTYDIRVEVSGAGGGSRGLRGVTIQVGERAEHVVDIAAPE